MKNIFPLSLIAAATLFSAQALADSPKWDLIELDYVKVDIDDTDFEPNGFSITGTKLLTDNIFMTGSYTDLNDDVSGINLDLENLSLGVGYRYGLTENTDWYGALSYVDLKAEASQGNNNEANDEDGFGISTGIRSMLTDQFELAGDITYVDIGDADETTFTVKGYYYVTEQIALSLGYGISSDANNFEIGARWAF